MITPITRSFHAVFLLLVPLFLASQVADRTLTLVSQYSWLIGSEELPDGWGLRLDWRQTGYYTSSGDPVNLVFIGDPRSVLRHFDHHLDWNKASQWSADRTYFYSHGQFCPDDRPQQFSSLLPISRDHIKFKMEVTGPNCDSRGARYVLGTVHHDEIGWCSHPKHVSRDFNSPRDTVVRAFINGGHTVRWEQVGNTAISTWCDGSQVQGDGRVAIIYIRTPVLEAGEVYVAALSHAGEEDTYTFEGVAGQYAVIAMHRFEGEEGGHLEPHLVLAGPDGKRLAASGGSGTEGEASIQIVLPQSGLYRLTARSQGGKTTGWYTLSVTTSISLDVKV